MFLVFWYWLWHWRRTFIWHFGIASLLQIPQYTYSWLECLAHMQRRPTSNALCGPVVKFPPHGSAMLSSFYFEFNSVHLPSIIFCFIRSVMNALRSPISSGFLSPHDTIQHIWQFVKYSSMWLRTQMSQGYVVSVMPRMYAAIDFCNTKQSKQKTNHKIAPLSRCLCWCCCESLALDLLSASRSLLRDPYTHGWDDPSPVEQFHLCDFATALTYWWIVIRGKHTKIARRVVLMQVLFHKPTQVSFCSLCCSLARLCGPCCFELRTFLASLFRSCATFKTTPT